MGTELIAGTTIIDEEAPPALTPEPPDDTRVCPSCGYSLAGLSVAICPECGGSTTPPPPPSLGQTTARGFAWMTGVTLLSKVLTTGYQIVLAWLLTKSDFGAAGIALAVAQVPQVLHWGALNNVLIQRQRHLHLWVNPAVWMSVTLSCIAGAMIIIAAPIAGWIMHSPVLTNLLLLVAPATAISGFLTVPQAMLQIRMRFGMVAVVTLAQTVLGCAVTLLLASLHWGPYALFAGMAPMTLLQAIVMWRLARPGVRRQPQLRRWRHLAGDGGWSLATNVLWAVCSSGDRLILGFLYGDEVTGVYFFSFGLALQSISVLSTSLYQVLFPAISSLAHDIVHQTATFLRVARLVAIVGVPMALLQAALADPGLRVLFGVKWLSAVPVVQVLSLGMSSLIVSGITGTLILGQGRFRAFFFYAACSTTILLTLLAVGAKLGGAVGAAAALAIHLWGASIVTLYMGIQPAGGRVWQGISLYVLPVLASVGAIGPGYLAAEYLPEMPGRDWLRIAVICASTGVIYPTIIRVFAREQWNELWTRLDAIVGGRLGRLLSARRKDGDR